MKVLINRKSVIGPWGGGNKFVQGMWKFGEECGLKLTYKPEKDIDAILLVGALPYSDVGIGFNEALHIKSKFPKVKIITRMNDHDIVREARNCFDGEKRKLSQYFDAAIFVSKWLKGYYENFEDWQCEYSTVIKNGVDTSIFKEIPEKEKISSKNGKINIVTHHWSSNKGKGFETYKLIEDFCMQNKEKYTFTYIGRHPGCFNKSNVIDPIFGKELGDTLAKYDVYVSASKYESGPNHVLEAVACNIPVLIHEKSGGGLEFVKNEKNYFKDNHDLIKKLSNLSFEENYGSITSMKECVHSYSKFIEKVLKGNRK